MGIISVTVFAIFLVGLLIVRSKLRKFSRDFDKDDPERSMLVWASRGCLVVLLVAAVGIVDGYIYKLPNPFSGPEVGNEMPTHAPPPPEPQKPDFGDVKDLRPDMGDIKDEHRKQLDDFENK